MTTSEKAAVFLDRDGTLNVEVQYLHRVDDFVWIEGAQEAIRQLNEAGLLVIVVTNQAGVARGYYDEAAVHRLHVFMQETLQQAGAHIDAFYHAPYHPEGSIPRYRKVSPLRKPGTGMFEQAISEWGIAPARSFVVGDKESDLEPGRRLGMATLLVETGYGAEEKATAQPDYVVPDVTAAVEQILHLQPRRS
ncbi:MAG TPA: HAD family hydrolase [Rhodothermales bacterium]|nr:HAD family hydrolase [Rhodothermales bacterium]